MALSLPSSPSVGQVSVQNSRTYTWTGSAWELTVSSAIPSHKATHATGGTDALSPADIGALSTSGGTVNGDLIISTGNVGIGTTTPGSRLEVLPGGGQGINCLNNGGAGTVNYAVMAQAAGSASANTGLYANAYNGTTNYGVRIVNPPAAANSWAIYSDATAQSYFAGNIGIGTTAPAVSSGVGLHISGSTLRLGTSRTPASSTATGNTGEICWDASYLYVCVSANTWRRISHSSW